MANKIPLAYADVELQISTAIGVGDTTFSLSSATDDDGNALPAGKYCFTVDNGSSNKEYLLGQLNGTDVTSVVSVSRQGAESSGANFKHRVGASAIVTDFATIQRVADILRGQETLDGANPVSYDTAPTLSDGKELATVQYVLDNITGGTVNFNAQTINGNAGETVADGDLVYFKTSDQEWYLTDGSDATTIEGVQLGIALGAGTDGASISGGIQISGTYTTTGLTAGSIYYASDTNGEISTGAGTIKQAVGLALSTTKLLIIPRNPQTTTTRQEDALAGGGEFGTPSGTNKFLTEIAKAQVVEFTSSGTWTKDAGLQRILVQVWGAGGSGASQEATTEASGGGGGGYIEKWFNASDLGATETVTIGAGGTAVSNNSNGNNGGNTTFGSLVTAYGGEGGTSGSGAVGGDGADYNGIGGAGNGGSASGPVAGGKATNLWQGGGGAGASNAGGVGVGGAALYGGAGGGSASGDSGSSGAGGSSVFGGDGGAASASNGGSNVTATSGTQPGGGGGAAASATGSATSGAGGDGKVIVTEYYV